MCVHMYCTLVVTVQFSRDQSQTTDPQTHKQKKRCMEDAPRPKNNVQKRQIQIQFFNPVFLYSQWIDCVLLFIINISCYISKLLLY